MRRPLRTQFPFPTYPFGYKKKAAGETRKVEYTRRHHKANDRELDGIIVFEKPHNHGYVPKEEQGGHNYTNRATCYSTLATASDGTFILGEK